MIREAVMADVPRLVAMGETFLIESQYHEVVPFRPKAMSEMMAHLIESDESLLLVSDRDRVDGMIGMYTYDHPLSGTRMAAEAFWWMSPECRGGTTGVRLLRQAEDWARQQGVPYLHMVAPNSRVAKFYERLGYRPLETHYYKVES